MDFKVSYPELRSAGDQFEGMESTGDGLLAQLQGVPLVQSDFGRIPWLQTRVWEAYSEHTTDCADALQELADTLGKIHEGLDATADAYEDYETNAAQACTEFFGQVI
ncbi:MAG: hypothetical protein ABIS84_08265 [Arachnia sp.]